MTEDKPPQGRWSKYLLAKWDKEGSLPSKLPYPVQIWRLGTRMVMVMSTDDAVYDSQRMRVDTENDPVIRKWEELMWTFQAPTPWTPKGQKWTPMTCVFDVDL